MGFLWFLSCIWVKILDERDYRKTARAAQIRSIKDQKSNIDHTNPTNPLDQWIKKQEKKRLNSCGLSLADKLNTLNQKQNSKVVKMVTPQKPIYITKSNVGAGVRVGNNNNNNNNNTSNNTNNNLLIDIDPLITYGGAIKNLECVTKRKLKIGFFANLKDGKSFRFQNMWCVKDNKKFFDAYSNHLGIDGYTYIAAHPKNFG